MSSGEFFSWRDVKSSKRVAALGQSAAKDIFVEEDPLDKIIWVNRKLLK